MIHLPANDRTYYHALPTITALPAVGAAPAQYAIQIEEEAYVELTKLLACDDAQNINIPRSAYGLLVKEEAGADWFNDYVVSDLIFGVGANPRRLPTPIIQAANSTLNVSVKPTGIPAAYNRFNLALEGVKKVGYTREQYSRARQRPYYVYATPFGVPLPAGATSLDLEFQIDADSDFVVQSIAGVGPFHNSGGDALSTWQAVSVQITTDPDDTKENYFKKPISWFQAFGQPDYLGGPHRLESPLVFPRKTLVRVSLFVDTTVAVIGHDWPCIQVGFEGYKIKG